VLPLFCFSFLFASFKTLLSLRVGRSVQ
jgi:hypothetical protein